MSSINQTPQPCDNPRPDPQDMADYPDEPRQCVCGWLISSHDITQFLDNAESQ